MAPKRSPRHTQPSPAKQQTLQAAFAKQKAKQQQEQKLSEGRWQIQEAEAHDRRVLEEKYVTTSTNDCEGYKKGSGLSSSVCTEASQAVGARKSARGRKIARTTTAEASELEEEAVSTRSSRWEEQGAAFLEVLENHLSPDTVLPVKHQELLLHMVMNADHHIVTPNLSTTALGLLLANLRVHPLSRMEVQQPAIAIIVNSQHLWKPQDSLRFEPGCYEAACLLLAGYTCSKTQFFLSLLSGAQHLVAQHTGTAPRPASLSSDAPGPVGLSMAFKYVATMLMQDFEVRMKAFREYGPHLQAPKQGLLGDLNAGQLLSRSALAQLLSGMGNDTTIGWPGPLKDVVHSLVALIVDTTPPLALQMPAGVSSPGVGRRTRQQAAGSAVKGVAPGVADEAAAGCPVPGTILPGEVGDLARRLLRCLYDLFLVMEEQRQVLTKEAKDTDCRILADTLYRLLYKKEGSAELKSRLQDPRAKSIVLSALSPSASLHLLGFVFAKDASRRYSSARGETVISAEMAWLQDLVDYAERNTTVRLICDSGPARVDPLNVLHNLDQEENFHQFRQCLLSHSSSGEGFVTWLTIFTSVAALAAQQGELTVAVDKLREAFNKVLARVQQQEGGAGGARMELQLHNRIALAKTQTLLGMS